MPRPSSCWPGDDLNGFTEIYPQNPLLQAFFNSEILDTSGVPSPKILGLSDPFDVRFRIELVGPGWQRMVGDWGFDIRFNEMGGPADFKLSSLLPPGALTVKDWKGCEKTCIELQYRVPPNLLQDAVYELSSTFRLGSSGEAAPIGGFESLEEYQWYS